MFHFLDCRVGFHCQSLQRRKGLHQGMRISSASPPPIFSTFNIEQSLPALQHIMGEWFMREQEDGGGGWWVGWDAAEAWVGSGRGKKEKQVTQGGKVEVAGVGSSRGKDGKW